MLLPQPLTRMLGQSPHVLFGKLVLIVLAGVWAGQALTRSNRDDFERAESLTREAYLAEYEQYRAALMDNSTSVTFNVLIFVFFFAGIFAIYEVAGYGLGVLSGRLARSPAQEGGPAAAAAGPASDPVG